MAKLMGIVGMSSAGKTTLIAAMLPLFSAMGLRVNVIKFSHHDVVLDPPGKDSDRFRRAGVGEVMLCSPWRYAISRELVGAPPPDLAACLARLAPADLTLIEGHKTATMPKLEVLRPSLGTPPLYLNDAQILAVASDEPPPEPSASDPQWLDLNEAATVAAWVVAHAKQWVPTN